MPPVVEVQFAPGFAVTSPGSITGSVYLFDDDGLSNLRIRIHSDDLELTGDSIIAFAGEHELTRPLNWTVPSNLLKGGAVHVIFTAEDLTGFTATDSLRFVVQ